LITGAIAPQPDNRKLGRGGKQRAPASSMERLTRTQGSPRETKKIENSKRVPGERFAEELSDANAGQRSSLLVAGRKRESRGRGPSRPTGGWPLRTLHHSHRQSLELPQVSANSQTREVHGKGKRLGKKGGTEKKRGQWKVCSSAYYIRGRQNMKAPAVRTL